MSRLFGPVYEWMLSTRKERERVRRGGVVIHTMGSGRRFSEAKDVLNSPSARKHFASLLHLTGSGARERPNAV